MRKTLDPEKEKIGNMRQKVNDLVVMYTELETEVKNSEEEWEARK